MKEREPKLGVAVGCKGCGKTYSWENPFSHPPAYGNYFVHRKDGKVHWEIWNGSGWAYNEKVITYWAKITTPPK